MANFQIIPAAAGYYALCSLSETEGYARFPIIGWQVDVTPGGIDRCHALTAGKGDHDIEAILCPDGTVNQMDGGEFWPTVKAWLAHINPAKPRKPVEPKSKPSGDPWYKA